MTRALDDVNVFFEKINIVKFACESGLRVRSILAAVRDRRPAILAGRARKPVRQLQHGTRRRRLGGHDAQHGAGREPAPGARLAQLPAVGRATYRRRSKSEKPRRSHRQGARR